MWQDWRQVEDFAIDLRGVLTLELPNLHWRVVSFRYT